MWIRSKKKKKLRDWVNLMRGNKVLNTHHRGREGGSIHASGMANGREGEAGKRGGTESRAEKPILRREGTKLEDQKFK